MFPVSKSMAAPSVWRCPPVSAVVATAAVEVVIVVETAEATEAMIAETTIAEVTATVDAIAPETAATPVEILDVIVAILAAATEMVVATDVTMAAIATVDAGHPETVAAIVTLVEIETVVAGKYYDHTCILCFVFDLMNELSLFAETAPPHLAVTKTAVALETAPLLPLLLPPPRAVAVTAPETAKCSDLRVMFTVSPTYLFFDSIHCCLL